MSQNRNFQKELDIRIEKMLEEGRRESLLLHACCAPCSSYVLEYLTKYFDITIFYYNPNITEKSEYEKRVLEIKRLIDEMPSALGVAFIEGAYEPERFFEVSKGLEQAPEGGERCKRCFRLRLEETARLAKEGGYDCFTTTLTISPLKNAALLNAEGERAADLYPGSAFLNSDFKKKDGYKRSIELSREYGLYRQDYCGCVFSKQQKTTK